MFKEYSVVLECENNSKLVQDHCINLKLYILKQLEHDSASKVSG